MTLNTDLNHVGLLIGLGGGQKLYADFWLWELSAPLMPMLLKCQLYNVSFINLPNHPKWWLYTAWILTADLPVPSLNFLHHCSQTDLSRRNQVSSYPCSEPLSISHYTFGSSFKLSTRMWSVGLLVTILHLTSSCCAVSQASIFLFTQTKHVLTSGCFFADGWQNDWNAFYWSSLAPFSFSFMFSFHSA